ncbi:uncharacterized protein TNCV_1391231 [Trichonephila clavipes]|nr:uncharacterized protein TNCV_1391231 [Trichonephila clavipes]
MSSHWCDVVVRRGQLRCHSRHLTMAQNEEVRRPKLSGSFIVLRSLGMIRRTSCAQFRSKHTFVPSRHGGPLNSRRAASPLVKLVAGGERREARDPFPGCSPQSWSGTELNRTLTLWCSRSQPTSDVHLAPCHEFRGPPSDYVRQVALATTTTTKSVVE